MCFRVGAVLVARAMPAPESRSVFEAAQDPALLRGLTLVTGTAAEAWAAEPAPASHEKPAAASSKEKARGVPEVMGCSTCGQVFGSREEQTEHYHLDWHRFNLKQRLLGRRALPVEVFEEKSRAGDVSSISGSDSESSDASSESELLPSASDSYGTPPVLRSHKVLLRNAKGQLISAYRCVLATGKGDSEEPAELTASLQSLSASTCWVVLMMGGGHFAGAVFRGPQVQEHKTFHYYTVRARRGTAQGLRDAQTPGSAPRSAGASLRRYNEAALLKDVQDLLAAWAQHLEEAQRIFLRAPRHNRVLLFGGRNPPLTQGDPRICHIPLSTRRATLREVLRVHATLASLQVYGKDTPLEDIIGLPRKGWQKRRRKAEVDPPQEDTSAPEEKEEEEEESPAGELETVEVTLGTLDLREFEVMPKRNRRRKKRDKKVEKGPRAKEAGCPGTQCGQPGLELVTELQGEAGTEPLPWDNGGDPQTQLRDALFTACKTGDVGTLRHLLVVPENGALRVDSEGGEDTQPLDMPRSLLNQPMDERGSTLLHVAARAGKAEAVCLLLEAGVDPALRDRQDRTPYCVSADKPTRNAFRKFMVDHPDKYDYSRAKVPGPLTQEMEAKKLEKKRAQKAQRKQREQAQREERQHREQEQEEKQRFAALSDREKVGPCVGRGASPAGAVPVRWAQQLPGGAELCLCSPAGAGCRAEAGCAAAGRRHSSCQHQVTAPADKLSHVSTAVPCPSCSSSRFQSKAIPVHSVPSSACVTAFSFFCPAPLKYFANDALVSQIYGKPTPQQLLCPCPFPVPPRRLEHDE
ncbi:ankyrin repeat and zinc finger domain-containing protein 1 isoform X2 [Tyto alba]|uniref:ankyrin repeat and zinc finger domain-containing protein 1 isoform X2 n=1 Tax=Tyto alba TaxID=56313 RepID=UPI001C672C2E|nr:ankyrin repeat and zinc finger domain-containing protein 1 isoform X2 [Tyto alba]